MALVSLLDAQPWYAIMARENRVRLIRQGCAPSSRQAPRQPATLTMCREMMSFSSVELREPTLFSVSSERRRSSHQWGWRAMRALNPALIVLGLTELSPRHVFAQSQVLTSAK